MRARNAEVIVEATSTKARKNSKRPARAKGRKK